MGGWFIADGYEWMSREWIALIEKIVLRVDGSVYGFKGCCNYAHMGSF